MKADYTRNIRINDLYKKALTGKYTWKDLRREAETIVSKPTAKSYLDEVENRLRKGGHLK